MADHKSNPAGFRLHAHNGQWMLSIPIDESLIIQSAQKILKKRFKRQSESLNSTDKVKKYLKLHFQPLEQETFACLFMDIQNRVIAFETLFYGTLDASAVYPREVVKAALRHNCAAVIAVHNHPSGDTGVSPSDLLITEQINKGLSLVGITLLDHLVVGAGHIVSVMGKRPA